MSEGGCWDTAIPSSYSLHVLVVVVAVAFVCSGVYTKIAAAILAQVIASVIQQQPFMVAKQG